MRKAKHLMMHDQNRLKDIRSELLDMASSYAGDETGNYAVCIYGVCNHILDAEDRIGRETNYTPFKG